MPGLTLFSIAWLLTPAALAFETVDPPFTDEELLVIMPAPSADRIWVQVQQPVSLRDLSRDLRLQSSTLAELNNVEVSHCFDRRDWVVLPSKQSRVARQLPQLDASQLRRTPPPLMAPAPVQATGVVCQGETLLQVAQRYGTTMQELLRLNPGLNTAGLVAGTEVQLVQSAQPPRAVLSLPTKTASLVPPISRRWDQSIDELVREGILSPGELQRIRGTGVSAWGCPGFVDKSTGVTP